MADKTLKVTINAKDGASAVFAKVGNSAQTMGDAISKSGDAASKSMQETARSAEDMQRTMEDAYRVGQELGRSMLVLAAAGVAGGKMFRDQQIALDTLERGYGSAADELKRFADQMQDTTNFSNDQAIAAANLSRTLADNYGFTTGQIEALIARTADLAAAQGKDLGLAIQATTSAMRGEAEMAEQLGLTLNDHALGIDKLGKSTSEYEKSQIRLNAFMEQSNFATGVAAEQADTFYGKLVQLRDVTQDLTQDFGGFLGPLGELGAFMADNAVQVGAMTLALGQLGQTAGALNTLVGGNLIYKTGAAGLGVGVFAAGMLAAMEWAWPDDERFHDASVSFEADAQRIQKAIYATQAVGDQATADLGQFALDKLVEGDTAVDRMVQLSGQITMNERAIAQGATELTAETERMKAEYAALTAIYGDATVSQEQYAAGATALTAIMLNQGVGRQLAIDDLAELNAQYAAGEISVGQYVHDLALIGSQLMSYDQIANHTRETNEALAASFSTTFADIGKTVKDAAVAVADFADTSKRGAEEGRRASEGAAIGLRTVSTAAQIAQGKIDSFWQPIIQQWGRVDQLLEEFKTKWGETTTALNAPMQALSSGFSAVVGNTDAIAKQSQAVADWAENLIAAEGTYSKLDDLVNAGRISGQSGVFTGSSEYAQAQQAYNSIMEDNAAIQEHVLAIQAKQAPMLAEMESNLESYMGRLADATPEQQAFALAMMDSSTATQAFDLATGLIENRDVFGPMAESLANLNPYLGEALVQMGLMDKVYNDSTGTYEYHINVDGGETALSQTQQLTQAIEALNKTFTITLEVDAKTPSTAAGIAGLIGYDPSAGGGLQIPVTADTSGFDADISAVTATEIPEKTAMILGDSSGADTAISNVNAAAIDTKTLTIGGEYSAAESAVNAVNNLTVNDKYMTIYATTVYSSIGTPGLGLRHGGIAGYAHGGIPVELAEAGSELLHFAGGGTMPIYNHGYYTVPPMTYVSPANTRSTERASIVVDFSGASFVGTSRAEMDNWAETSLVPNLRKVLQDERAGYLR